MLAIAITTAPRPVETFTQSYSSLRDAGFTQGVFVFDDGNNPSPIFQSSWTGRRDINNPPRGGLKNWAHALETLVNESDEPWLMVLEDDVLWARGAAAALEKNLRELEPTRAEVGYLSLYLSRKVSREIERRKGRKLRPGIYASHLAEGCWGSQAYVFTREGAIALLADPTFDDRRRNYEKNRNRDGIVSGCLAAMGRRLYYRVPCLVDHSLGNANSSLGPKPVQYSLLTNYWTGRP